MSRLVRYFAQDFRIYGVVPSILGHAITLIATLGLLSLGLRFAVWVAK